MSAGLEKAGRGRFAARTVRVKAPGKVNVSLAVGPLRPDGYHSVASVYLAVSLYEEVAATSTAEPGITISLSPRKHPGPRRGRYSPGQQQPCP